MLQQNSCHLGDFGRCQLRERPNNDEQSLCGTFQSAGPAAMSAQRAATLRSHLEMRTHMRGTPEHDHVCTLLPQPDLSSMPIQDPIQVGGWSEHAAPQSISFLSGMA